MRAEVEQRADLVGGEIIAHLSATFSDSRLFRTSLLPPPDQPLSKVPGIEKNGRLGRH
jgi:hypothetical protein